MLPSVNRAQWLHWGEALDLSHRSISSNNDFSDAAARFLIEMHSASCYYSNMGLETLTCSITMCFSLTTQSHRSRGDEPWGGPGEVSWRHVHPTESAGPADAKENGIKCKWSVRPFIHALLLPAGGNKRQAMENEACLYEFQIQLIFSSKIILVFIVEFCFVYSSVDAEWRGFSAKLCRCGAQSDEPATTAQHRPG